MPPKTFPDCNTAALHEIGAIQPLGSLVAVNSGTGEVDYCSDNTQTILKRAPQDVLGHRAEEIFGPAWNTLAELAESNRNRLGDWQGPWPTTVVGYRSGCYQVLELEPAMLSAPAWWDEAGRLGFLDELAGIETQESLWKLLTDTIMAATGYDRVMVYRFLRGWDGEVIHEHCRSGITGFLGLRFPASDIPANARALYLRNWQRIIANIESDNVAIVGKDPDSPPLDLTLSFMRAVHPVHIQYMSNMGLRSSFSLSLIVDGELWGMVTCHHHRPKVLGARERLALEEVARLTCLHLRNLLHIQRAVHRSSLHERLVLLDAELDATSGNSAGNLIDRLGRIGEILEADSVWLRLNGEDHAIGPLPEPEALEALVSWLAEWPDDQVGHYEVLPEALQSYHSLEKLACGVLYLPLSDSDAVFALRKEAMAEVRWAGRRPCKSEDTLLSPRSSFETWTENVRFHAEPWDPAHFEIAETLRGQLIEHLTAVREKGMAYSDQLTGLANRYAFEAGLQQAIERSAVNARQAALHMIDLDKFKPVNDRLGHAAGDELLRVVAVRLLKVVRNCDLVARLGGDEFAIIQQDVESKSDAEGLAQRVIDSLMRPIELDKETVQVGASLGFALYPSNAGNANGLQELADKALYRAKDAGRGTFRCS